MGMHRDRRTILLTGATGMVGMYVLRELLARRMRVVVLLRGPLGSSLERLARATSAIGVDLAESMRAGRVLPAEGTLPASLPHPIWGRTDDIIHCAACLQLFGDGSDEPHLTNVQGTRALTSWADAHGVPRFHLVSTAYACGMAHGVVREVMHHAQPEFHTDYQRTKWLAETDTLRWARSTGRVLTILRPGLVIGDSATGFTQQFSGFYQLARMVDVCYRRFVHLRNGSLHLPMRLPGRPDAEQNLVPADFLGAAITEIVARPELHGRIYHLTNPAPPINAEIKSWFEAYYDIDGGEFADGSEDRYGSAPELTFLSMNEVVLKQFEYAPRFDCTNTTAALADSPVTFPRLTPDHARRMLDFAIAAKWGRKRAATAASA